MGKLTVILGGARSGKSTLAEELAAKRGQKVLYIATAQIKDDEMKRRIQAHREQRPPHWKTLELSQHVGTQLLSQKIHADIILLDCLTLLISNCLLKAAGEVDKPNEEKVNRAVNEELKALITAIQSSSASWIIVSNEVGMGLVPPYPAGRLYRDALGKANRQLTAIADEAYLLVSGMPIPLHTLAAKDLL
jgi:adenosylcobinamide kinase / adenosylcobinamide-phosphate guanylyltransferase